MKTSRKIVFGGLIVVALLGGMLVNFALTAPGSTPSSQCVKQPDGTFTSNGRVCDRVDYTIFKQGLVPYVDPYFYHLVAAGWTFANYSYARGGSYFTFTTHNLITTNGITLLQNQIHSSSTTTFTVQYLGVSDSSSTPNAADTAASGSCADTGASGEISVLGLTRTSATYTAGTASGGSISPQLSKTWTAYGVLGNVNVGCAWNTGTYQTGTLYAENTFSAVNMNAGDQLTITWTFTYSG